MRMKTQTKEFKQLLMNSTSMAETKNGITFSGQGVVGDQLSVERGINSLMQIANGLTEAARREGLHFELADFHSQMKFLQVLFLCIIILQF